MPPTTRGANWPYSGATVALFGFSSVHGGGCALSRRDGSGRPSRLQDSGERLKTSHGAQFRYLGRFRVSHSSHRMRACACKGSAGEGMVVVRLLLSNFTIDVSVSSTSVTSRCATQRGSTAFGRCPETGVLRYPVCVQFSTLLHHCL